MRAIDSEALIAKIMNEMRRFNYDETRILTLASVIKMVDELPTEDVKPVVRGEWKHLSGDEWVCSSCGYVVSTEGSWERPLEIGKDYCERCGADMREVKE